MSVARNRATPWGPPGAQRTPTGEPERRAVEFSEEASAALESEPQLRELIEQVLGLDPRPRYHQDEREYGTALKDRNVRWRVVGDKVEVESVHSLEDSGE